MKMLEVAEVPESNIQGFRGVALEAKPAARPPTVKNTRSLVARPHDYLGKIRAKTALHLKSLAECNGCVADRGTHPDMRAEVERRVVSTISRHTRASQPTALRLGVFADSGMFQTLVLIQKLRDTNQYTSIHVDLIDPFFGVLCVTPECEMDADDRAVIAKMKLIVAARCVDFLDWFCAPTDHPCPVTLAVFHRASRWAMARRRVDALCAIDWLDELGSLPSGGAIRGDWLVTQMSVPPHTLIADFNVMNNRSLTFSQRTEIPCPFDPALSVRNEKLGEAFGLLVHRSITDALSEAETATITSMFDNYDVTHIDVGQPASSLSLLKIDRLRDRIVLFMLALFACLYLLL